MLLKKDNYTLKTVGESYLKIVIKTYNFLFSRPVFLSCFCTFIVILSSFVMKNLLWLPFLLLIQYQVKAQFVSDFNATDINGNNHNLFATLETGKIVILVFFSTNSPTSMAYHNSDNLNNLYNSHGPSGDNQLEIYYIEGDPNTSDQCLTGSPGCNSTSSTVQNWTTGIEFPIISSPALAQLFQVNGSLGVFVICPNKRIREIPMMNSITLWKKALECPVISGENNVGIYYFDPGIPNDRICTPSTLKPRFSVVNTGSNQVTGITAEVRFNNQIVAAIPIVGTLMPLDERFIEVPDEIILMNEGKITVTVNKLPNEFDTTDNRRERMLYLGHEFVGNEIKVRIRTDQFGNETYWEIKDALDGTVIASGGNECVGPNGGGVYLDPACEGGYGEFEQRLITVILPHVGCYKFNIVDAFGDGMLSCTQFNPCGYYLYELPTLYQNAPYQGSDFGSNIQYDFNVLNMTVPVPINVREQIFDTGITVFPNPTDQQATIRWDVPETQNAKLLVYNSTGELVYETPNQLVTSQQHYWTLNTASFPDGVYVAMIQGELGLYRQLFVKQTQK